jgi:hypothetical protein
MPRSVIFKKIVMLFKKFNWFYAGLFLVSILLLTNCEDDNNELGLDIQPPYDKLNVFSSDTTRVVAYSQIVDSVKTDETSLSMLGSMVDPVFGRSTASFYSQFRLSETAFDFGTTPYPDSLVLTLDYEDFYGDSNSAITVKVYELAAQILIDSVYYSHQTLENKGVLLGQKTFVPDYSSDVVIGEDTINPHLRIRLSDLSLNLAIKLLTAPADSMDNNASFLNYFYGLYVTAEDASSGGQIISFDLLSGISEMQLHYHNATEDSLQFDYLINSNCGRFGSFTHDYSLGDASFKSQVIDKDTALGSSLCYIQAMGGVKTFVRFPDIKNYYANGNIAVNEARFFLSCNETDPLYEKAIQLVMVKRTEEGSYTILEDQLDGAGYFGGYYDDDLNGYWFRITSTIQDLMKSDDPDYGYELYVSGGAVNAERVLLNGTAPQSPVPAEDRMRLVVTYTTLN